MKIKFIGVPGEEMDQIHSHGVDFPKGKWVEVSDRFAIRKLSNHPHFEAKAEEITDVEAKAQEQELQALTAAALEPLEAEKAAKDNPHGDDPGSTGNAGTAKTRNRRSQ